MSEVQKQHFENFSLLEEAEESSCVSGGICVMLVLPVPPHLLVLFILTDCHVAIINFVFRTFLLGGGDGRCHHSM